jgi:FkbM family methyltransferase
MRVPPEMRLPAVKAGIAAYAAETLRLLVPDRRVVVQAGGCVGIWPLALAQTFDRVYTAEPAPENFALLAENIADTPSITAWPVALGAETRGVGLARPKPMPGLWRVAGDGPIPMVRLDAILPDGPVDAIVLDVEGSELAAWQGAEALLARWQPLLWFEAREHTAALEAFLAAHGYGRPQRGIGWDWFSRRERG